MNSGPKRVKTNFSQRRFCFWDLGLFFPCRFMYKVQWKNNENTHSIIGFEKKSPLRTFSENCVNAENSNLHWKLQKSLKIKEVCKTKCVPVTSKHIWIKFRKQKSFWKHPILMRKWEVFCTPRQTITSYKLKKYISEHFSEQLHLGGTQKTFFHHFWAFGVWKMVQNYFVSKKFSSHLNFLYSTFKTWYHVSKLLKIWASY